MTDEYKYVGVYLFDAGPGVQELLLEELAEMGLKDEFGDVKSNAGHPYRHSALMTVFAEAKASEPITLMDVTERLKDLGIVKCIYKQRCPLPGKPRFTTTRTFAELTELGKSLELSDLPRCLYR